jgi:leucyl-tRNA synthetase
LRFEAKLAGTRRWLSPDGIAALEQKWQRRWHEAGCFSAQRGQRAEKFFNFDGGPFPNGPLHMGHVRTFTLGDVMARYQRMRGKNVLYCFEFDAFGLPNELAAETAGISPAELTARNIERMRMQMIRLGLSYDWNYVHTTSDPRYYRWTQWLFLKLYEAGLVYRAEAELNWCPGCRTTLAYIQVEDGRCWRCNCAVERRTLPQWYVALSRYSKRLHETLHEVSGFGPRLKNVLGGFLGATSGFEIDLPIAGGHEAAITAFVAPERVGEPASYVAIARDHRLLKRLPDKEDQPRGDSTAWVGTTKRHQRTASRDDYLTAGWFTGLNALDPRTGLALPVYSADHVEATFAQGAVLGFPALDRRDRQFAEAHGIRILEPACSVDTTPSRPETHYRVHDWLVSRQRSWGTPIPFVHCQQCGSVPLPANELPVLLPEIPAGGLRHGLADLEDFTATTCRKCDRAARRETDTLDCYFDVIWCFLACASRLDEKFDFQPKDFEAWLPVDWFHNGLDCYFYMHLYRFLGHVLHDLGILSEPEPFRMYMGHDVVTMDGRKMSKHHGNVVDPSKILETVGADVLRVDVLWSVNPNKSFEWSEDGLDRASALIAEIWSLVETKVDIPVQPDDEAASRSAEALELQIDRAVRRTTSFLERYQYSGSLHEISRLAQVLIRVARSSFNNDAMLGAAFKRGRDHLLRLFAPFAPHVAEEAWERLGRSGLIATASWPSVVHPATKR